MKFLNAYCEVRKAEVFINLDKIVLLTKTEDGEASWIELDGKTNPVKVAMTPTDLVRKINGEDRTGIGFRTGR